MRHFGHHASKKTLERLLISIRISSIRLIFRACAIAVAAGTWRSRIR
jgi:hypothetical protein